MADSPMTAPAVAEMFGVTAETVKNWAEDGKLRHFRTPGGHYRFHRSDVDALLAPADPEAQS